MYKSGQDVLTDASNQVQSGSTKGVSYMQVIC